MKNVLVVLLLITSLFCKSQDLHLEVSVNKNPVVVGEPIQIAFTINAKGENFRGPNFEGFNVRMGPNPSTSSSFSFINGKSSSQTTTTFSYIIQAKKTGELSIGPASIIVNGTSYQSKPIIIRAEKGNTASNTDPTNNKNNAEIGKNQLFLQATTNKSKVYQGEQIVVTYRLFTRVELASTELISVPSLNGFWTEDIKVNSEFKREIVNGIPYQVATIKKTLLTAQESGELEIDPMKIRMQVVVRGNSNDPFAMFNAYTSEQEISSKPIKITVLDLPTPKPKDFFGAVGDFKISTEVDNKTIKANEAINFRIILSGRGNLSLLEPLDVAFPPDFEVYDPKIIDKTFKTSTHTEGKKIFEYLLIPRYEGNYEIPSINYAYFNPTTKQYNSLTTEKQTIKVLKSDEAESTTQEGTQQEDVKLLQSDIRYIKDNTHLKKTSNPFFLSLFFWILLALPITLTLAIILYRIFGNFKTKDTSLQKSKLARKLAKKRLKLAKTYLQSDQHELFYAEIEKSLWGYLSDKFEINISQLSKETVQQYFEQFEIKDDTKQNFINLLTDCEMARYAPAVFQSNKMTALLLAAEEIIVAVEQQKK